jgi:hypothetical protein
MAEPLTHAALVETVARAIDPGAFDEWQPEGGLRYPARALDALRQARAALRAILEASGMTRDDMQDVFRLDLTSLAALLRALADAGGGDE